MGTTKEFFMWGKSAEVVIRLKHDNGTTIEVPVSDVTEYVPAAGRYSEIRIPLRGEWMDKLIVTHDFTTLKQGW